jgi:2-polyprenyl-3-methyl-5-hydroxy-6-metoxy-1,4-benzoquinol methylase
VKQVLVPELLDSDAWTEAEVRIALDDLRRINRWFGGTSTTLAMLEQIIKRTNGQRRLSLLEVASGTSEGPRAAAERARKRGVFLRSTCLDRSFAHVQKGTTAVVGDALDLPFANESFDLVSCGLFAHHLQSDEIVRFAQEALRVARVALLINDLERSLLHWAMAWIGRPLWRSRLTRHDSVVSVRRSYTPEELRTLLQQARPVRIQISRHYFFRYGAIAWKM